MACLLNYLLHNVYPRFTLVVLQACRDTIICGIFYHVASNFGVFYFAKRGYCNAGVCVCLCVHSPISHHTFVKCEQIITKLYMGIAEHDSELSRNITSIGQRSRLPKT